VNKENIQIVRDHLANLSDDRFSIRSLVSKDGETVFCDEIGIAPAKILEDCGTAACIAGWANVIFHPRLIKTCSSTAAESLGLDNNQEIRLFLPHDFLESEKYTRELAIRVLDHLIETGKVDWDI
jgi:hypothetical protein